jgi:exopolyphosphatase/guanosine-5'-triphosphate,3'-diphosphate pyrophosphatase
MIAIDLGSNSIRVIEFDCSSKRVINRFNKVVKTADKLNITKEISKEAIERIIARLKEADALIEFGDKPIRAITTEAMRQAKNSTEALEEIRVATGVSFEVISGEEEAMLTLLAVESRLERLSIGCNSFVLIDIGGASTEIIYHYPDNIITKSFPIGIVTISQSYSGVEQTRESLPKVMEDMYTFAKEVRALEGQVELFVATAGTPTTIASMKLGQNFATYNPKEVNGTTLEDSELEYHLSKLISMTPTQREIAVGVGRSELITAGALIFAQLYKITDFRVATIIDDGLREGVALDWCLD